MTVFNQSIACGKFPKKWNLSTKLSIYPILKVKNSSNPNDYRPVNTTVSRKSYWVFGSQATFGVCL